MNSSASKPNFHPKFRDFALKSIGTSVSLPKIPKILKSQFGEEKFKASVDKKISEIYLKLLQNRISKLQKEEEYERKKLEFDEKIKADKLAKKTRKLEFLESRKIKEAMIKRNIDEIREKIEKSKEDHDGLMQELKKKSMELRRDLNTNRKNEKISHLRIKSMFIETCRVENSQKAQKIREKIKNLEISREENKANFKNQLRKQYLTRIEQEKKQKLQFEDEIKSLESQENLLLQRLGKSYSTTIQSVP